MTIGEKLYKLRQKYNYSLREVEELTNKKISYSYLSQLENNDRENPSKEKLKILAELYKVPLSYFYISEKVQNALTPGEMEQLNEMQMSLLRESRGMSEDDLIKVIKIMKAFKDNKTD